MERWLPVLPWLRWLETHCQSVGQTPLPFWRVPALPWDWHHVACFVEDLIPEDAIDFGFILCLGQTTLTCPPEVGDGPVYCFQAVGLRRDGGASPFI